LLVERWLCLPPPAGSWSTNAHEDAHEAEEKLVALIERKRADVTESERLRKQWDDLLQAVEGLRTVRDLAHRERADAQQRINLLEGDLEKERDLKIKVEGVTARLATEVSQHQEEI
jgi:hypothetical protein